MGRARFAKTVIIALVLSLALGALAGCDAGTEGGGASGTAVAETTTDSGGISLVRLSSYGTSYSKVYTSSFQTKAHSKIASLKSGKSYTIDDPLVVENPYGTVTDSLYVYFKTSSKRTIRYLVQCEGYADFQRTVESGSTNNLSKKHEWLLIGCVPGKTNTVTIEALDKNGATKETKSFEYTAPESYSGSAKTQLDVTKGTSATKAASGLYTVFGDERSNGKYLRTTFLYDNSGVLRAEMPVPSYRISRFLFKGGEMYYGVTHRLLVRMDRTGYLDKFYKLSGVEYHHDYIWGKNNDILFLGSDISSSKNSTEDRVCSLNIKSGKIKTLVDMRKVVPAYFKTVRAANTTTRLDWMHLNSIDFIGKTNSIIISSRETSTLFVLKNPYKYSNKIVYMIGSKKFWKGTGYAKYLLKKKGTWPYSGGQHTIAFDSYKTGSKTSYYVSMYDNNVFWSASRPSYNWKKDSQAANSQAGYENSNKGGASYYYRYLVNTKSKTVKLVKKKKVAYSYLVSSTQNYKGRLLIGSGHANWIYEYGSDGKLIQKMKTNMIYRFYRTFKYTYDGFWFAS